MKTQHSHNYYFFFKEKAKSAQISFLFKTLPCLPILRCIRQHLLKGPRDITSSTAKERFPLQPLSASLTPLQFILHLAPPSHSPALPSASNLALPWAQTPSSKTNPFTSFKVAPISPSQWSLPWSHLNTPDPDPAQLVPTTHIPPEYTVNILSLLCLLLQCLL